MIDNSNTASPDDRPQKRSKKWYEAPQHKRQGIFSQASSGAESLPCRQAGLRSETSSLSPTSLRSRYFAKGDKNPFFFFVLILIVGFFGILAFDIQKSIGLRNFYTLADNFIQAPVGKIKSNENRTNILIMGQAGSDHEGSDLTDTMILISVSLTSPKITMISIPRDLWIPEIRTKINSAYHYGGIALAKESTQRVLGIPIHYGVLLNFSGFKDIVNVLGGITVNVQTEFTDPLYPINGKENDLCDGDKSLSCRYQTLHFNSGSQIMDGDTALKFVRSRHAEGIEGTDIAREARQQKVISAIESKIIDPKVLLNPNKSLKIWNVVMGSIETDINMESGATVARYMYKSIRIVKKYLIPENLLINPPISAKYDKQYIFIPKIGNGNWKEVHDWVKQILF